MTPERWQRIKRILSEALELPPHERADHIACECGPDTELQEECLRLLRRSDASLGPTDSVEPVTVASGMLIAARYRIERELGRGGFAVAYLARDTQLHDRRVVVKVLSDSRLDSWYERKFVEEVRAVAAIDDPAVVAPLDTGRLADGVPYIVMQFIEGVTLKQLMSEGRLPPARAAEILRQTGRALDAVHRHGIYHRDIKPANIMIQALATGGDHVRLIDFGIASLAEVTGVTTVQTRVVGSLPYMAPEQLQGKASSRTDIYALGAVAYELITGVPPFQASNVLELSSMQRAGVRVRPSQLQPSVSAEADRLIVEALSFDPAKRPAGAAAWAAQLGAALTPAPAATEPRRTVPLWAIASLAALLLVAVVVIWKPWSEPAPAHSARAAEPASQRLSVALIVSHASGLARRVTDEPVAIRSTDSFRVEVVSAQPGHLYLYSEDLPSGSLNALFPSQTVNDGSSFVAAETPLVTRAFAPDPGPGAARLWVVWSSRANPAFENAKRWANPQYRGEVGERDERAVINQLLAAGKRKMVAGPGALILAGAGELLAGSIDITHR